MNAVRSASIVCLRKILRSIYSLKLHRYPTLKLILNTFSSSKSAALDLADAIALYEYITLRRPSCILELGPGTSTNIICQAIEDIQQRDSSYSPRFLSYEENPSWLLYHEQAFVPELRKHVELALMDSAMTKLDGVETAHYLCLPILPYDFILIDGPDFLRHGCQWSCDVLDLMEGLADKVLIVFDGRERTVREVWSRLKNQGFSLSRHI